LIKRKIETLEPIQWAIDFLEEIIGFYFEKDIEEYYWIKLLKEKKRELLEDFYALAPSFTSSYQGLGYCEGFNGGRMLAMRILINVLPPYQPLGYSSGKWYRGGICQLKTFEEVLVYLKSLHLAHEGDRLLWRNSFFSALKMLLHNNYLPSLFYRGSWPALLIAPPYREKTTACYLFNPHIIVLYSLPEKSIAKRTYLILHEIGHLIFEKYLSGKPLPQKFTTLLANMKPERYPELIRPSSQGIAEVFANLFAMSIMYGTEEGEELFHSCYQKMGKDTLLLQRA
jgi:hypothetical protein